MLGLLNSTKKKLSIYEQVAVSRRAGGSTSSTDEEEPHEEGRGLLGGGLLGGQKSTANVNNSDTSDEDEQREGKNQKRGTARISAASVATGHFARLSQRAAALLGHDLSEKEDDLESWHQQELCDDDSPPASSISARHERDNRETSSKTKKGHKKSNGGGRDSKRDVANTPPEEPNPDGEKSSTWWDGFARGRRQLAVKIPQPSIFTTNVTGCFGGEQGESSRPTGAAEPEPHAGEGNEKTPKAKTRRSITDKSGEYIYNVVSKSIDTIKGAGQSFPGKATTVLGGTSKQGQHHNRSCPVFYNGNKESKVQERRRSTFTIITFCMLLSVAANVAFLVYVISLWSRLKRLDHLANPLGAVVDYIDVLLSPAAQTFAGGETEPHSGGKMKKDKETLNLELLAPATLPSWGEFGVPKSVRTFAEEGFGTAYDPRTKSPIWTLEVLTAASLANNVNFNEAADKAKCKAWFAAPGLDLRFQDTESLYSHSLYDNDEGHLAAAANHKESRESYLVTHSHINRTPQTAPFNRGYWERVERWVREDLARQRLSTGFFSRVFVASGPLYLSSEKNIWADTTRHLLIHYLSPKHLQRDEATGKTKPIPKDPPQTEEMFSPRLRFRRAWIPTHFFKVVLAVRDPASSSSRQDDTRRVEIPIEQLISEAYSGHHHEIHNKKKTETTTTTAGTLEMDENQCKTIRDAHVVQSVEEVSLQRLKSKLSDYMSKSGGTFSTFLEHSIEGGRAVSPATSPGAPAAEGRESTTSDSDGDVAPSASPKSESKAGAATSIFYNADRRRSASRGSSRSWETSTEDHVREERDRTRSPSPSSPSSPSSSRTTSSKSAAGAAPSSSFATRSSKPEYWIAGFVFPHQEIAVGTPLWSFHVPVDIIEALAGVELFPALFNSEARKDLLHRVGMALYQTPAASGPSSVGKNEAFERDLFKDFGEKPYPKSLAAALEPALVTEKTEEWKAKEKKHAAALPTRVGKDGRDWLVGERDGQRKDLFASISEAKLNLLPLCHLDHCGAKAAPWEDSSTHYT
ncbi:unnamed protein product [Amoebophrya sp. A25]|nr:unnamed protein product [Amoebophrya sp. A25]|eukprot:GSA25T00010996001.1